LRRQPSALSVHAQNRLSIPIAGMSAAHGHSPRNISYLSERSQTCQQGDIPARGERHPSLKTANPQHVVIDGDATHRDDHGAAHGDPDLLLQHRSRPDLVVTAPPLRHRRYDTGPDQPLPGHGQGRETCIVAPPIPSATLNHSE
ncbi:hypothetical protein, partial [Frankia sp. KB5]|uniref:hypothetical protein n=1 Tax=Frankia sp. KB5 TaxID=683318 RepID=UPI001A7E0819